MEEKAKEPVGEAAKGLRSVTACFGKAAFATAAAAARTTATTPEGACIIAPTAPVTTAALVPAQVSKPTSKETSRIALMLPNAFDGPALATTTLTPQEVVASFLSTELNRQMKLAVPPKEAEKDLGPPLAFVTLINIIQA